jgi:hypothetical protein
VEFQNGKNLLRPLSLANGIPFGVNQYIQQQICLPLSFVSQARERAISERQFHV